MPSAKISLLIGSGFSVPAGYPTTTQLNERLQAIHASDICIHTSREAWFLNGGVDPNAEWMGVQERHFVQEFLEFYNGGVLHPGDTFHYETFFDYYIDAYRNEVNTPALAAFMQGFRSRHHVGSDDHHLLMEFNDTFSQLLAHLLTKPIELVHLCKPYASPYNVFLLLLEEVARAHTVHIHTLNHDLNMERFSSSDCMQGQLADGFDDLGSNIYVQKHEKYVKHLIRLRRFTNKFDELFCLYKLHGGIDHYWCTFQDGADLVKVPWGTSPDEIVKEVSRDGQAKYINAGTDVVPDFLSGTTHKISRYQRGPYYPTILDHFRTNLRESKSLVVIGYGFKDTRINQLVEENFLSIPSKVLVDIDVIKPEGPFLDRPNAHFVNGGVSEMNLHQVLRHVE